MHFWHLCGLKICNALSFRARDDWEVLRPHEHSRMNYFRMNENRAHLHNWGIASKFRRVHTRGKFVDKTRPHTGQPCTFVQQVCRHRILLRADWPLRCRAPDTSSEMIGSKSKSRAQGQRQRKCSVFSVERMKKQQGAKGLLWAMFYTSFAYLHSILLAASQEGIVVADVRTSSPEILVLKFNS